MELVTFSAACRACQQTNGLRWSYEWDDREGQRSVKNRTDFGVMQVVELILTEQGTGCPLCGSPHLELFDMDVDGHLLFDFEQQYQRYGPRGMNIFSVKVDKAGTQLEVHLSTLPTKVEGGFLAMALDQMAELVRKRPAYDFAAHTTGSFYCCVSGRWADNEPDRISYLQKYTSRGLSRQEALFVIQSLRDNIDFPPNSTAPIQPKSV